MRFPSRMGSSRRGSSSPQSPATPAPPISAPRETRTPTQETLDKALNLDGGVSWFPRGVIDPSASPRVDALDALGETFVIAAAITLASRGSSGGAERSLLQIASAARHDSRKPELVKTAIGRVCPQIGAPRELSGSSRTRALGGQAGQRKTSPRRRSSRRLVRFLVT